MTTYPPITTLTPSTTPNLAKPPYRAPIFDPVTGTRITRISDKAAMNETRSILRHAYAKAQPFNSDGSRIILAYTWPALLLDGNDYHLIESISLPSYARWMHTDPRYMIGIVNSNQLVRVDMANHGTRTVIKTFSYSEVSIGDGEGNLSIDDRVIALQAKTGNETYLLRYDLVTGQTVTISLNRKWPDWVAPSQSGLYIVVCWATEGTGRSNGVEVFDSNLQFLRQIHKTHPHGDLGKTAIGDDVFVCVNEGQVSGASVVAIPLSGAAPLTLIRDTPGWNAGHVSCRNTIRPGYCYLSSYGGSTSIPGWDEVFGLQIGIPSGVVERFGHEWHTPAIGYDAQPHGVPSPDGAKVLFASDWKGGSGAEINAYVAEMPPMMVTTPPPTTTTSTTTTTTPTTTTTTTLLPVTTTTTPPLPAGVPSSVTEQLSTLRGELLSTINGLFRLENEIEDTWPR